MASRLLVAGLSLLSSLAAAQTWSLCNPTNRTDCAPNPALGTNATFNFTEGQMGDSKLWNGTNGKVNWEMSGAQFTVVGRGDSPTIQSNFYLFFGVVSVVVKAANGKGIVSSMVLQSDDLDEVDWEFIGGNNTHVQTNYFGKGNTTSYDRAIWHPVDKPIEQAHNYTVHWTQDFIDWYVDDKKIRTLNYGDALNGRNFPQTPMNIRLGAWAGGDPENNSKDTVAWAGGETDFRQGPFTMTIQSVYAQDFHSGKEYTWSDKTGDFKSIKVTEGKSAAQERLEKPHGVQNRWKALPQAAKIAIIAGAIGVTVAFATFITICCIKQRRLGRREHLAHEESLRQEKLASDQARQRMDDYDHHPQYARF